MDKLREKAMRLLTRREYARSELSRKLVANGFSKEKVDQLIDELMTQDLQSDERYVEAYVSSRITAGYGSKRIIQELKQRGLEDRLIIKNMPQDPEFWWNHMLAVWKRKFERKKGNNRAHQFRFLSQRGFELEQIYHLLGGSAQETKVILDD